MITVSEGRGLGDLLPKILRHTAKAVWADVLPSHVTELH